MKQVLAVITLVALCCPVPGQSVSPDTGKLTIVRDGGGLRVARSATNAASTSDRLAELRRRSRDVIASRRASLAERTSNRSRRNGGARTRATDTPVDTGQNANSNTNPAPTPSSAPASCDGSYQIEWEFLDLVNMARSTPRQCGSQSFGAASPLTWDQRLATAAGRHSQDMATYDVLNHTGTDGSNVGIRAQTAGYQWRAIGENIAVGFNSPESVLNAWLESPGHCANIMNSNYSQIGVASARNDSALYGNCARWWTLVVARPR